MGNDFLEQEQQNEQEIVGPEKSNKSNIKNLNIFKGIAILSAAVTISLSTSCIIVKKCEKKIISNDSFDVYQLLETDLYRVKYKSENILVDLKKATKSVTIDEQGEEQVTYIAPEGYVCAGNICYKVTIYKKEEQKENQKIKL